MIETLLKLKEKLDSDEDIKIKLSTIEVILKVKKFIEYKEGRDLSFKETISYVLEDYVDRKNILDLNKNKKN